MKGAHVGLGIYLRDCGEATNDMIEPPDFADLGKTMLSGPRGTYLRGRFVASVAPVWL